MSLEILYGYQAHSKMMNKIFHETRNFALLKVYELVEVLERDVNALSDFVTSSCHAARAKTGHNILGRFEEVYGGLIVFGVY